MRRLRECYPEAVITATTPSGPFHDMRAIDTESLIPWDDSLDVALDLLYIAYRSGDKIASEITEAIPDHEDTIRPRIGSMLLTMYLDGWRRMYAAMTAEYNPINNYDMVETERRNTSSSMTGTSDTGVHGYGGGASAAPTGKVETSSSGSGSEGRSLTRSGNIGVTTSAQMIEGELTLRSTPYWDHVFSDLDKVLTNNFF